MPKYLKNINHMILHVKCATLEVANSRLGPPRAIISGHGRGHRHPNADIKDTERGHKKHYFIEIQI